MLPTVTGATQTDGWKFSVHCPGAEQVMLVAEDAMGFSSWLPMATEPSEAGTWTLELPDPSVAGPVRYYTIEGGSILNCGTVGLTAVRIERGRPSAN